MYEVRIRNWWIENPSWPNGREPGAEPWNTAELLGVFDTRAEARESASYSNHFADLEVREVPINGTDWVMFILYLDGEQVKRSAFNNKTKAYLQCAFDERPITDWITDWEAIAA